MTRGSIEKLPEMRPQVKEFRRKGFRELYVLDDTWNAGIFMIIGATPAQYSQWLKDRFNLDGGKLDGTKSGTASVVQYQGAKYDVITIAEKWTWGRHQWCTLVHELHHVTTNILLRKGLTHSEETEECWAYLQDSLLGRFIWGLNNRRKVLHQPRAPKKRTLAKKRGTK